jgi:hypothetical protein
MSSSSGNHPRTPAARSGGACPEGAATEPAVAVVGDSPSGEPVRGPLQRAVTDLDEMVELGHRRQVPRQRLRGLIDQTDMLIAACERAHLDGATAVTEELATGAEEVWVEARTVLAGTAGWAALRVVERIASRQVLWIHQLMDALWRLEEETFNVLVPWRAELADNDESDRWSERIPA